MIVEATKQHLPDWATLRNRLWPHHTLDQCQQGALQLLMSEREDCFLYIDTRSRNIVGFIEVSTRDYAEGCTSSPVGYIEGLFVDESNRARGIGLSLIKRGYQWMLERGCTEVASDVQIDNHASIDFHKHIGFSEVERSVAFKRQLRTDITKTTDSPPAPLPQTANTPPRPIPYCVIVTGRPGSGKTTLAEVLGRELHLPVLSRDAIKEGYIVSTASIHSMLPPDSNWKATEAFFKATRSLLEAGISIVVEAAFQHRVWEIAISEWIRLASVRVLVCQASPATSAKRAIERGLADPHRERFHGDPIVQRFRETGELPEPSEYQPPAFNCPTLTIDTENGYQPTRDEIISWLNIEAPQ